MLEVFTGVLIIKGHKVISITVLVAAFIAGFGVRWLTAPPSPGATVMDSFFETITEQRQSGYRFINPLLECNIKEPIELQPFKYKVQNLVTNLLADNQPSFVSVYFRDLNDGPWFGINADTGFSPASLLKVPLMMAYYKKAEQDPSLLEQKLVYTGEFNNNTMENVKPAESVVAGTSYTINDLIRRMVVYSDNNAMGVLFEYGGKNDIWSDPYTDLGIQIPGVRGVEDVMSVKDYASFFRVLYNASYLDRSDSEQSLKLLSQVDFRDGIVAGVPQGIAVAHKFGERKNGAEAQLHDCGIVYHPKEPFLLCIMTRGTDFLELKDAIKQVTSLVYHEVDAQTAVK